MPSHFAALALTRIFPTPFIPPSQARVLPGELYEGWPSRAEHRSRPVHAGDAALDFGGGVQQFRRPLLHGTGGKWILVLGPPPWFRHFFKTVFEMTYRIGFLEGGGRWLGLGLRNPILYFTCKLLAPAPVSCLLLPHLDGAHSCAPTHVCVFGFVRPAWRACVCVFFISTLAGDGVGRGHWSRGSTIS